MKPKAALVKAGILPEGSENKRGRLSGDHIAKLKELAAKGWNIEGYSVSAASNGEPVEVKKVSVDPNRVLDVPDEARNEKNWNAFVGGKRVGMREVCRRCSNSFTYCHCEKPLFPVDFQTFGVVVFKPTIASKEK